MVMLRWARERLLVAGLFAALAGFVSCALNPQPEPPGDKSTAGPTGGVGSTGAGGTSLGSAGGANVGENPTTGAGGGAAGAAAMAATGGAQPVTPAQAGGQSHGAA